MAPVKILRYCLIKDAFTKNQHAGNIKLKSTAPSNKKKLKDNIAIDKTIMKDYFSPHTC